MGTTISLSMNTKERLQLFGNKGQTYDEIVGRLMEIAEKSKFSEEIKTIIATEKFVDINEI